MTIVITNGKMPAFLNGQTIRLRLNLNLKQGEVVNWLGDKKQGTATVVEVFSESGLARFKIN
jgi:hypothetical protein